MNEVNPLNIKDTIATIETHIENPFSDLEKWVEVHKRFYKKG